MAALAIVMAACSNDSGDNKKVSATGGIPFTATISTGGNGTTRTVLTEAKDAQNKDILTVDWKQDDKIVLIYEAGGETKVSVANVDDVDNSTGKATISATLDANTTDGTAVTLRYPATSLDGTSHDFDTNLLTAQEGTLDKIDDDLDWREGSGTLTGVGSTATLAGEVKLQSQVVVWKLNLKNASNADLTTTKLTIKNGKDIVAQTADVSATNEFYMVLPAINSGNIKIEADNATDNLEFAKSGITLAKNTYYQSTVTLKSAPLTLKAIEDGTISVTFNGSPSLSKPITYTKNGTAGAEITATTNIDVEAGDEVCFYSTNAALAKGVYDYVNIKPSNRCAVYGNVMSLINDSDAGDFTTDVTLGADYALYNLFIDAAKLENHATKKILLPATNMTVYCYKSMFERCASLQTAPSLPSESLARSCYQSMFSSCTSLTTAPTLPAKSLARSCYNNMFTGCTSLQTPPLMLAESLADHCYDCMFNYCTSLQSAPSLPVESLTSNCYHSMFYACKSLQTAPSLQSKSLASSCYENMFGGCTSLQSAPELPATTLADHCYRNMFNGCTSLNLTQGYELKAGTLASDCYNSMFKNCSNLTVFPTISATTLATNCYICMFQGCTKLGNPDENYLSVTTLANGCYQQMFAGCTSITKAPRLPATTLVTDCYKQMFKGCTNLNEIKCYATNPSSAYTLEWCNNVSSSGNFYYASGITWDTGVDGIPENWSKHEQ